MPASATTASAAATSAKDDWLAGQRYGRVPLALLVDDRLTDEHRRVWIALACHVKAPGECFPLRSTLATLSRMHTSNVSSALTALTRFGWVEITHRSGRSSTHQLTLPDYALEKLPQKKQVPDEPKTRT